MTDARPTATPPIEIDAAAGPAPLGMPPATFLRDYWQKRPLLVRNAFPGYASPIEPEDLAGLACEDGVLARLIEHDKASDGWKVRHGPFAEDDFPGLPDHDWTLLVQDVDKWDADIRTLLAHFGSLDTLLARADEVAFLRLRGAAATSARLREHADIARLSRALTGIAVDAPVPASVEAYARRAHDWDAVETLFDRLRIGPMTRARVRGLAG